MKQYTATQVGEIIGKASVTVRVVAARNGGIGQKSGRDWVFTDEDIAKLEALPIGKPRGRSAVKPGSKPPKRTAKRGGERSKKEGSTGAPPQRPVP